jgi:uncharacterized protein YggT (Ycf19 family)
MLDNKLARDEAQSAKNYEATITNVQAGVGEEISAQAHRPPPSETPNINQAAENIRQKAGGEVVETRREIKGGGFFARISQIVHYIFFLIYGLLGIRLLLAFFAADNSNEFVQLIKNVTDPLYSPFEGIIPSLTAEGGYFLLVPIIVAIFAYMFLYLAIIGLLRIFVPRKTTV